MTTALDTITGALRLLGVVGSGQVPAPEDSAIALTALNEMLESWSVDNLTVFTTVDQTFALVPGTAIYTLGPTGTWVGFRPTAIWQMVVRYQTIDYQVGSMDVARFNAIPFKAQAGVLPIYFSTDATVLNMTVSLWPVPNTALPVYVTSNQQLAQIPTLSTVLVLPPGYARALRFNLAKDLQSEFGGNLSPSALQTAAKSLGDIKRANILPVPADFDPAFTSGNAGGSRLGNFIAGLY